MSESDEREGERVHPAKPEDARESPTRTGRPGGSRAARPTARPAMLPERYEALETIGRGGWGEILRVRDLVMGRNVAMKLLAAEHLGSVQTLGRFLNEATITASLEHPGVVPVHDRGVLPDGRPWFTMKEVRGRTLSMILREESAGAGDPTRLRRLVDMFARICETVGFAHRREVVHRDLKPSNVMVGELGEVLVLDWGIARRAGETVTALPASGDTPAGYTQVGDVLGTATYMSPEQARGANDLVDPRSDVFALGLLLFEILTGRAAREHDRVRAWVAAANGSVPELDAGSRIAVPEELRVIYQRAVQRERGDRYRDGEEIAEAVRAFLDGAARRDHAARVVANADALAPRLRELRQERDALVAQAATLLATVQPHDPAEAKAPAWRLEDRAARIGQDIAVVEAEHIEMLRVALEHDPEHADAHARLAAIYRARVLEAENRGEHADAARFQMLLRRHDRGEHARFLAGLGQLELDSEPSGVRVRVLRYELEDRRLVPRPTGIEGMTPFARELPAGSYLVVLERNGWATVRYPVRIARDAAWDATRPGHRIPTTVKMPRALDANEVYVPAGWADLGDDEHAAEPVPATRVWIDDFVIQRVAVTCREYLAFLDSLWESGDEEGALRHAPRWPRDVSIEQPLAVERVDGRFVTRFSLYGAMMPDDAPITLIDWHSARTYAAWLAARTGRAWRLPNELEWEKAARGVDRRPFPWGAQPETTWARMLGATAETPTPVAVGSYPVDESPYGVRDLAGNVRTWCANAWTLEGPSTRDGILEISGDDAHDESTPRSIRGGSYSSVPSHARAAGRFASRPDGRFAGVGLRLVRSP